MTNNIPTATPTILTRQQWIDIENEFIGIIRGWLKQDEIDDVNAKNEIDLDCDALHKYCDPNFAMMGAYESIVGGELDIHNDQLMVEIYAIWQNAKISKFEFTT